MKQKRIIIILVATAVLAFASNSQAVGSSNNLGPGNHPVARKAIIFKNGGTPSKTGPNAGAHILATPHAAGPAAGPAGGQAANPLLLDSKKKPAN